MKNIFISTCVIAIFASCKKECRECECTINGNTSVEKNCATGSAGIKNLDTWEKYLEEEKGCQNLKCYAVD